MKLTQQEKDDLARRLREVRRRIAVAGGADLLPITKFHPVEAIEVLAEFGVGAVGRTASKKQRLSTMFWLDAQRSIWSVKSRPKG